MVYVCSMGFNAMDVKLGEAVHYEVRIGQVVLTSIGGPLTSEVIMQSFKGGLKLFNHAVVLRDDLNGRDLGGCICSCERSEPRICAGAAVAKRLSEARRPLGPRQCGRRSRPFVEY